MAAPFQSGDDYHGFAGQPSVAASVTSTDASAISAQAASAINVVSNRLSNLISVHDVLSNRVSANSGGAASVTSNDLSALSAEMMSVVNVVSNAASNEASVRAAVDSNLWSAIAVVSNAVSNEISDRSSAVNVVSNALSNAISDLGSAINVVSNALSNAESDLASAINVVSNAVSSLSAVVAGLGTGSVTSNELSVVSAQAASAIDVVSNAVSNLASVVNDISVGAGGSVTSNELSVVSAQAASAIDVVSNALSVETDNRISGDNALSNAISVLSATVTPQYFYPTGLSVKVGVLATGSVGDLSAFGGGSVMVCEIVSTPGFLATLQFSAVSEIPNRLVVHGEYEGGAGHVVNVEIFNHLTSLWNTLGTIADTAGHQTFEFDLGEATAYLSATNSRIRFNHVSVGLPGHEILLDYVVLGRFLLGAGITDHGALQGLSDDDHTLYALADGTRGFTATTSAINTVSNAASVVSNALSVEVANRASAVNVVSNALSNEISNRASADNVLSNAISGLQSAHDALSNRVSVNSGIGGGGSVTSNELSAGLHSVYWAYVSGISATNATLSNEISVRGAEVARVESDLGSVKTDLSYKISTTFTSLAALSNKISAVSAVYHGTPADGLQSAVDALSNQISNNLSTVLAQYSNVLSAYNALAAQVSNLLSAHDALSNRVSVNSA